MNDGANTTTTATISLSPPLCLSLKLLRCIAALSLFLLPKLSTRIQIRVLRLLQHQQQQQQEPQNYLQMFSTK